MTFANTKRVNDVLPDPRAVGVVAVAWTPFMASLSTIETMLEPEILERIAPEISSNFLSIRY